MEMVVISIVAECQISKTTEIIRLGMLLVQTIVTIIHVIIVQAAFLFAQSALALKCYFVQVFSNVLGKDVILSSKTVIKSWGKMLK